MRSRPSTPRSRADRRAGFSLLELLVTVTVAGVALGAAVTFFADQLHAERRHATRVEAQQALRSSLDAITRDLRLAGACLPGDGQFVALAGVDAPDGDGITVRTGLVRDDMSCIVSSLTAPAAAGATAVSVASGAGFGAGMLAYVRHPNGSGEIVPVAGGGGTAVAFSTGLGQAYPAGSGVYAVDERSYALDESDPSLPVLTLTVNRGPAQAFAAGMRDLQVRYVLDRNCTPCDEVDLPASTAEWQLVNRVALEATVETLGAGAAGEHAILTATSTAKPRNLLP